jgi:hypothetical protein
MPVLTLCTHTHTHTHTHTRHALRSIELEIKAIEFR